MCCNYWSLCAESPFSTTREATAVKSGPHSQQLEKACTQRRPNETNELLKQTNKQHNKTNDNEGISNQIQAAREVLLRARIMKTAGHTGFEMQIPGSLMLSASENDKWQNDRSISKSQNQPHQCRQGSWTHLLLCFREAAVWPGSWRAKTGYGSSKSVFAFCEGGHQRQFGQSRTHEAWRFLVARVCICYTREEFWPSFRQEHIMWVVSLPYLSERPPARQLTVCCW